jgi:DNA-binding MarR family transcriptional regulator
LRRFLRCSHIFDAAVQAIGDPRGLPGFADSQLTLPQLHLLKALAQDGQHRVSDVAAFLGVTSPAATKCVDKLERLGLVKRAPCAGDRRATLLEASAAARRLVRDYDRVKRERLSPILSVFAPQEIDQLIDLLERFAVELCSREDPASGTCLWCGAYFEDDCPIARTRGGCPCHEIESPDHAEKTKS